MITLIITEKEVAKMSPSVKSKTVCEEDIGDKGSSEKGKSKKIELEVTVCHFVSPSEFYLQLVRAKDELEK